MDRDCRRPWTDLFTKGGLEGRFAKGARGCGDSTCHAAGRIFAPGRYFQLIRVRGRTMSRWQAAASEPTDFVKLSAPAHAHT